MIKKCIKNRIKNCKNILNAITDEKNKSNNLKFQRNNYKDKYNLLCYDETIK